MTTITEQFNTNYAEDFSKKFYENSYETYASRNCCSRLSDVSRYVTECIDYYADPVVNGASSAAYASVALLQPLVSAAGNTASGADSSSSILVGSGKIAAAVAIPFAIYGIIQEGRQMFSGKHKIDSAFRMVQNVAWLADSTGTFVRGLCQVGAVGQQAMQVAFGFTVAGAALSVATIALHAKAIYQSNQFLEKLNKKSEKEAIDHALAQSAYRKEKYFNFDATTYNQLTLISANANTEIQGEAKTHLINRVKESNFGRKLAILSAVVSLVAMAVLLFTPAAPIGFFLLAVASGILLAKFFYERRSVKHFSTKIQELVRRIASPAIEVSRLETMKAVQKAN